MEKEIYIVVTQTGTILSRIIKLFTKAEYNHSSISLSPDLRTMYSFGRVNPYIPFWGGFVTESPHYGTFKRFSNTRCVVLSLRVSQENYASIQRRLNSMSRERRSYHYNVIGLFLAAAKIPYHRPRYYYCSEFVMDVLRRHQLLDSMQPDPIPHPSHFLQLPHARRIFCGKLAEFS